MEYNFLLMENNKLSIQHNKSFTELSLENLESLKAEYSLISTFKIKSSDPLSSDVLELLKDNEVVVKFEKVSSALKEIDNNKIISHLNRENFRKISFPIFVKTEYLKNFLEASGLKIELSSFIKNSRFQKIELDS
tara:strand:- start:855 stop:1259 length:405 start_codon:yes stop_codon:yes gene_type:complete